MKLELNEDERKRFLEWDERHIQEAHGGTRPYEGAIGGRLTFKITPTTLGPILKVMCACGAEECLTNFDDW